MIRSGGSSGFTEPERNPSPSRCSAYDKLVSVRDAGRAGSQPAGAGPQEVDDKEKGRLAAACSLLRSVFARQQDGFVQEIQGDLRKREIRVFDGLG